MSTWPSVRAWKLTALFSLVGCGVLWLRTPSVAATTQGAARCAEAPRRERQGWLPAVLTGDDDEAAEGSDLEALLAQLDGKLGVRARCRVLARIARRAGEDQGALERVLRDSEPGHPAELRSCAIGALGLAESSLVVPWLIELLEAREAELSEAALQALIARDDEEARNALLDVARSAEQRVAVLATIALAEAGANEAAALVAGLLDSSTPGERERMISGLGRGGNRAALSVLTRVAAEGSGGTQYVAVQALGELGGAEAARALLTLIEQRPGLAPMISGALARTQDGAARKGLLEMAESGTNRNATLAALQALSAFDDPEVRAMMSRALDASDPQRTNAALEYFAQHPDAAATAQLMAVVKRGSMQTAYGALNALSRSHSDEANALIEQLARAGGPMAGPAMMTLMQLPDGAETARELALTLVKKGGPQAGQAIEVLAQDSSPEARAALIAVARRNDPSSSPQALNWLGQRGDPESRRVLEEVVAGKGTSDTRAVAMYALVQSGGPQAEKALLGALQSDDGNTRAQAIGALAQLGGPNVEQALLKASRDSDPNVTAQAVSALGQVGSPAALGRLEELARGSDPMVTRHALMSLTLAPERMLPIAKSLATSSEPSSRAMALEVVHALPEQAATSLVLGGLRDSDSDVVRMALGNYGLASGDQSAQALLRSVASNGQLAEDVRATAKQLLAGQTITVIDEE